VLIAAQMAWWASIALPGQFRNDDLLYIKAARETGLWTWLGQVMWEHFAPGHRLAFWLVGSPSHESWVVLQLVLVAAFGCGLAFLYGSLRLLYGNSWWLLVPLAVSGFAWQFSLGFAWPSAGLQLIPEFAFGTLCLYAFLRHLKSGEWGWLAVSAAAFTLGLAFYVRTLVLLLVLLAVRYLFLERDLRPRNMARLLWEDRLRWLVFALPAVLYLRYFWQHHALESPSPRSAGDVLEYVHIAWLRNVVPGLLGIRAGSVAAYAPSPSATVPDGWTTVAEIAGQVLVIALVALSLVRKRADALRAWAYVVIVAALTFWLTARGKVGVVGPSQAGYDPRYVSNLCWQVPLGVVFALHPRRVLVLGEPWPAARRAASAARRRLAIALGCVLALATTGAMITAHSVARTWQHADSRKS
jgi:hypothetical protein